MERLRIATVGPESQRAIVKADRRNTWQTGCDRKAVLGVAGPKFVQDRRSKGMNVAELKVRGGSSGRIQEAARYIGSRVELVPRAGPVKLGEEAIALAEVIVQP